MLLRLDPDVTGPLHERIAVAVRTAIAGGDIHIGERLPTARDVAGALDVNVNTVLRAYRDLRDEGLIELRRGRGATVLRAADGRARLTELVDQVIDEAGRVGISPDEVTRMVKERS